MKKSRMVLSFLFVASTVFSIHVSAEESTPPVQSVTPARSTSVASRIVDGTNVAASQFPTVGEVGDASGTFCTGTLISPRHVLTAGHCVTNNSGVLTLGKTDGRFRIGGQTYSTSDVIVHPTYNGNLDTEGIFDVAVLVLATPVTTVTPTALYRKTPTVGQILTLAGYGVTGTGTSGVTNSSPVPVSGTIDFGTTPIDEVTATLVKWNFENKTGADKESNTAPGDSGGPAFITESGVLYLAGVTSGGNNVNASFGDKSYDTRVDAVAAWVDSIAGTSGSPTLTVVASTANASEIGPVNGVFTISRTGGDNTLALTVNFTVTGTATTVTDYATLGTSTTIAAGASSATVTVVPVTDATTEGTETVILTPTAPTGYVLGMASATVKILEVIPVTFSSAATATPSPAKTQETVTFNCAVTPTGSNVSWNFGDGSTAETGTSVTHSYSTAGTYSVVVTISDSTGASTDSQTIPLTVSLSKTVVTASVSKTKVNLNFKNPSASRFEFKVFSSEFVYLDRFEFEDNVDGTTVEIYLGDTLLDTVEMSKTRGFGSGTLMWNARKGELTYKVRGDGLEGLFADYGAINDDTTATLTLPIYVKVGGTYYGQDVSLRYIGKADRTGMAK